jgi:putative cardiolipin synthase
MELALPEAAHGTLQRYGEQIEARLDSAESAYWLLDRNERAFTARLALTDEAVASLDIQYFIWQEDATGNLLAGRLIDAADQGVRIRLLLDDFGVSSSRSEVRQLDAHPHIEVRVFNPWANRTWRLTKGLEFLFRWGELNRRMHNKTYIADNRFAIVGGRNIGDRYFGLYEPFVQDDLDVLVAGPLVSEISASFDLYWNSGNTYPMSIFRESRDAVQPLEQTKVEIAAVVADREEALQAFPIRRTQWTAYFEELTESEARGPGELYYDAPPIQGVSRTRLYSQFKALVASAQREVLISSPYFIPDRDFRELIRVLVARGVRVAIVTNSLASNNHIVAHTGYRRWRRHVLRTGAELYELRSDADALTLYVTPPVSAASLGLHTKAVVVDGLRTFIGSPNVDPRSMVLNTEIGVVAESAELARRLTALIARDMAPENAWRVTLDDEGWLTWSNDEQSVRRQPARNFKQRVIEFFLNLMPLKNQA